MATIVSSWFKVSTDYVEYRIETTVKSQSPVTNSSSVNVQVIFRRTSDYATGETWGYTGTIYCKINGTTYKASCNETQKITRSGIALFNKTVTVKHNDDGTKNLTVTAWANHERFTSDEQGFTPTLTKIARQSTIKTVEGNTINSPVTVTVELDTPSDSSSSFKHDLDYRIGEGYWHRVAEKDGTTITFTPDIAECEYIPNSTSGTMTLKLYTYSGDDKIGTEVYTSVIVNVPDVKPGCTVDISDGAGLAGTYGGFIQNRSQIHVTATPSEAYGSPITSCQISINSDIYSADDVTVDAKTEGTNTITATVTDARGRSFTTDEQTVNVIPYFPPTITALSAIPCDADGNYTADGTYKKVVFSAIAAPINNQNNVDYLLEYKKTGQAEYTSETISVENKYDADGYYIFAADKASAYDIRMTVSDDFGSDTKLCTGSSTNKVFSILSTGKGIAFGKTAERQDTFESAWSIIDKNGDELLADNFLPITGGTLTGNLSGKNITGTWLQTTEATDLGTAPAHIAVLNASGVIYKRTPAEILSDINAFPVGCLRYFKDSLIEDPSTVYGGTWEKIDDLSIPETVRKSVVAYLGGYCSATTSVAFQVPFTFAELYSGFTITPTVFRVFGLTGSSTLSTSRFYASGSETTFPTFTKASGGNSDPAALGDTVKAEGYAEGGYKTTGAVSIRSNQGVGIYCGLHIDATGGPGLSAWIRIS